VSEIDLTKAVVNNLNETAATTIRGLKAQLAASDLALRVLRVFAFDKTEMVWWRTDEEYAPVTFFVNCNDLFFWGCSDCEPITAENIELLERTAAEIHDDHKQFMGELFVARWRKMRPQGACYKSWPDHIKELFNACGPERSIDIGNPYTQDQKYAYRP